MRQVRKMVKKKYAGEKDLKCVLCKRIGEIKTYIYPDTMKEEGVILCRYHYANYMSHGIKKLNEMMFKLREITNGKNI